MYLNFDMNLNLKNIVIVPTTIGRERRRRIAVVETNQRDKDEKFNE